MSSDRTSDVRFGSIDPDHVRRVVQHCDRDLFLRYCDDAVAAGWARDAFDEQLRLAGLFHQVFRIGKAKNLGSTIAMAWKNRDSPEKRNGKPLALKLSHADQEFAARLLRPATGTAIAPVAVQIVNPLRMAGDRCSDDDRAADDLPPDEIRRQQLSRTRNLQALAAMSRRSAEP